MAKREKSPVSRLFTRMSRLTIVLRASRAFAKEPVCNASAAMKLKHPVKRGFIKSELPLDILVLLVTVLHVTAMLLLLHRRYAQ